MPTSTDYNQWVRRDTFVPWPSNSNVEAASSVIEPIPPKRIIKRDLGDNLPLIAADATKQTLLDKRTIKISTLVLSEFNQLLYLL